MNPDVLAYLPLIAPIATLVVVIMGVLFSNHHVDSRLGDFSRHMDSRFADMSKLMDSRFADMSKLMDSRFADMSKLVTAESSRLEAVLRLEISGVANRVQKLEERAGLVFRG